MKENEKKHPKLLPSYYYFNEKGLLVFTEDYHLSRGHCCGNKCLHCCYDPRHEKGVTNIKKD